MTEPIKLLKNIKSGPYVEFLVLHKQIKKYKHWSSEALFLEEGIYSMFSDPFDNASKEFNYYGPTYFQDSELKILYKELYLHLDKLKTIESHESFINVISSFEIGGNFLIEYGRFETEWESVLQDLFLIDEKLIALVDDAFKSNMKLLVLGV